MTYGKTTVDDWKAHVTTPHGLANVCIRFLFAWRNGEKLITNARKVHPAFAYFGTCWIHTTRYHQFNLFQWLYITTYNFCVIGNKRNDKKWKVNIHNKKHVIHLTLQGDFWKWSLRKKEYNSILSSKADQLHAS